MIGGMRERLAIQRKTMTSDGIGGKTAAWTTIATVWAKVSSKVISGREGMVEGRMTATLVNIFTVYASADVTEVDRLLWYNEPWNIRAIQRDGSYGLTVEISAERGVAS